MGYAVRMILRQSPWLLRLRFSILLFSALMSFAVIGAAQTQTPTPALPMETMEDLSSHLTSEQKQQFDEGLKAFNSQHYADAFAIFKALLSKIPGDAILSGFASEAALNTGDTDFALTTMKPLAQANPDNWQAAVLLTRACAESGDVACRDAGMAHMIDLHRRGITPPRMQHYVVERIKAGANTLIIRASLEPWGGYKVYDLGQVQDADGKVFLRTTIESGDGDQIMFAKEHPKEAAAGQRSFSLDAYRETGMNSSGQRTQTHFTYKFFVGQPSYETVRQEFINIVNGKSSPISSRSNLVVP